MRKIALLLAILGTTLVPMLYNTAPAHAQATRTWISGVGDDANPCSRTAPCKTFAGAISKTASSGEIDCLDPGGFGALTITKPITLDCENTSNGGVLVSGTPGITVATTGAVNLIGLDINGLSPGSGPGTIGVNVTSAANVNIRNCKIYGFSTAGIQMAPNAAGGSLAVDDVVIVTNPIGIKVDGSNGSINGYVRNSNINNNTTYGIFVTSTSGTHGGILIDSTAVTSNPGYGLLVSGANTVGIIGNSTFGLNGTGVSAQSGGLIYSFKNNQIGGNSTADGTPLTAYPAAGGSPLN